MDDIVGKMRLSGKWGACYGKLSKRGRFSSRHGLGRDMSKAFTKENDIVEDDGIEPAESVPQGAKNYITPAGHLRLKSELKQLVERERPEVVRTVSWAASNGDRSENGDYIYGKRRLREIDRRVHYLMRRLEIAEVVDPRDVDHDRAFFGATVTYIDSKGKERTVSIVGTDEVDPARGRVSWVSPIAKALLKSREGEVVALNTPAGPEELEVVKISYRELT
jgi:transcription elongation factor GreB